MFLNSQEHLSVLEELKCHAADTYNVLLQKDFTLFAQMIDKSWQLNQKIDGGTSTPEIQQLIERIQPFILGQKLLGAGGGGFMLMLAKDKDAAVQIKNELTANPVNPRGRFVNFELSNTGFQVTKS
jgi:galactokinase/mevalonate kinase-like predicted kinase